MGLGLLGGKPARGTTGHLQSSVCRLQTPAATAAHNQCFQQVQEDMSKARSTCKDWDFVSKSTEISVGRFLIEYFTPVTLGEQHQGALSDEDGKRIINRLGSLLLSEHEKLFGSYWRQVFGPPSSLIHLLGRGLTVRVSNSL
jgi:hypothetical protein